MSILASLIPIPTVNVTEFTPIDINKNEFVFGRFPSSDHVFSDLRSSSRHAIIRYDPSNNSFILHDNASNGTFLNSQLVGKGNIVQLKHNDVIAFVRTRVEYKFVITCVLQSNRKRQQKQRKDTGDMNIKTEEYDSMNAPPKKKRKLLDINNDIEPLQPLLESLESIHNNHDKESDKKQEEIKKESKCNKMKNPRRMRASDVRNLEIETKSGLFSGVVALMIAKKSRRLDIIMEKFIENGGEIYDEMDVEQNYELIKQMNTIIMNTTMPFIKLHKVIKDDSMIAQFKIATLDWISDSMQHKKVLNTKQYIPKCLKNNNTVNIKHINIHKAPYNDHCDEDKGVIDNERSDIEQKNEKNMEKTDEFIIEEYEDKLLIVKHKDWKSSFKILSFDMDGTLITTQSGNRFPKHWKDFRLLYDYTRVMETKLTEYHSNGYSMVIFSNQKISHLKHKKPAQFHQKIVDLKQKIPLILRQFTLKGSNKRVIPFVYFAALNDDIYRKPHRGMFEYLNNNINSSREHQLSDIVFVGDAAGREKGWKNGRSGNADFSGSDRAFAGNCNMRFFTPEEFWLNTQKCLKFRWMNLKIILENGKKSKYPQELVDIGNREQEMVILVGYPGCGKTTLYKRFFYAHNYKHINRDSLGSMERCVSQCQMFIQQKYSVVIDNTNPSKMARKRFMQIAHKYKIKIRCVWIQMDRALSHHLNVMRWRMNDCDKKIPIQAYKKFDQEFAAPQQMEGFHHIIKVPFVFDEGLNNEAEFLLQT